MRLRAGAWIALAAALTLGLTQGGCGRKGDPVLPDKRPDSFPRQYPTSTEPQSGVFG